MLTITRGGRRAKVFGTGPAIPLDRNAKARVIALARAYRRRRKITRAALDVLTALLFGFHNSRDGRCFPSYEAIAERAGCARSTVAAAIRALELAGLLTWSNRIARMREAWRDAAGRIWHRYRVIRTSNAYTIRDPGERAQSPAPGRQPSKSDPRTGTSIQETLLIEVPPDRAAIAALAAIRRLREAALFGAAVAPAG